MIRDDGILKTRASPTASKLRSGFASHDYGAVQAATHLTPDPTATGDVARSLASYAALDARLMLESMPDGVACTPPIDWFVLLVRRNSNAMMEGGKTWSMAR
jgi:hypothetical protein